MINSLLTLDLKRWIICYDGLLDYFRESLGNLQNPEYANLDKSMLNAIPKVNDSWYLLLKITNMTWFKLFFSRKNA